MKPSQGTTDAIHPAAEGRDDNLAGQPSPDRRTQLYAPAPALQEDTARSQYSPRSSPELSDEERQEIQAWGSQLKARFPNLLEKRRAVAAGKLLTRVLKPPGRAGRPRKHQITRAIELENQGIPKSRIPGLVIPNFVTLKEPEQRLCQAELFHAVWTRKDRERRNKVTNEK